MLKNLVFLAAFTTFVVLVWIALTVYHALTFSTVSENVSVQIIPLKPSFNTSVISGLKAREQIPVNLESNLSTPSSEISAPSVSPTATPLTTPTIPTSTPSGGLTPGL